MRSIVSWVAVMGSVGAIGLAGCGPLGVPNASTFPGNDLVTPAQAKITAQQLVARIETALENADANAVRSVTTSPLLGEDLGGLQHNAPGRTPVVHAEKYTVDVEVAVPHQHSYPATFWAIAKVSTPDYAPFDNYFEFSKAAGSAPWLIDQSVSLEPNQSVPALALDSRGFAYTMSPALVASALKQTPGDLADAWTNDFNAVSTSGRTTTTVFAPTYGTTGFAYQWYLGNRPASSQAVGVSGAATGSSGSASVAFATADGGALLPFIAQMTIRRLKRLISSK